MDRENKQLIRLQWVVWAVLFVIAFYFVLEQENSLPEALNYALHTTLSFAFIVYFNALWLIPQLYRKKRYVLYGLSAIVLVVAITYIRIRSWSFFYYHFIVPGPHIYEFKNFIYPFFTDTVLFISSIAFRFTIDFFIIKEQQKELLNQHAEAQLNLLKAQVQPHFLFNTLNNIYYVARQESPKTADLLEKLSSIIRFFLDQGSRDQICLHTELDFIRDYVSLEEIRIRFPIQISINISGDTSGIKIPPMLLIPLVENVFKHGIDKSRTDNYIDIAIHITERLEFIVKNALHPYPQEENITGTGLKNLTGRLNILFSNNYSFHIRQTADQYTGVLNIPYAKD